MTRTFAPVIVLFFVLWMPGILLGQAAVDLKTGTEAMQAGELEKARSLLESAAQDLPDSVEAQMALAECYLKLGQIDDAVSQYRKVRELSPNHEQAGTILAALTGQKTDFEQKLATAVALMKVGAFSESSSFLHSILDDTADPQQRIAARLLQLESHLWAGNRNEVLTKAMQLSETGNGTNISGPARIMAALALLQGTGENPRAIGQAVSMVQLAGDVAEPWKSRGDLVNAFAKLMDPESAVDASSNLGNPFSEIPEASYRRWAQNFAANHLLQAASISLGQGNSRRAMEIVWPMISADQVPVAQANPEPIQLDGGWLDDELVNANTQAGITRIFVSIAQSEVRESGHRATLFGYWLAVEYNRQLEPLHPAGTNVLLSLAGELVQSAQPSPTRKPGDPPGIADQMQKVILLGLANRVANAKQKDRLIDLVTAHITRFEAAGDLATGLAQFVTVSADGDERPETVTITLSEELAQLGPGPAHRKLLVALSEGYSRLGQLEFANAVATLKQDANQSINQYDRIALTVLRQLRKTYAANSTTETSGNQLVERYVTAGHWAAAFEALDIFYDSQTNDSGRWAAIQLKLRQATGDEDRRLATHRRLGDQFSDLVGESIRDIAKIVEADSRPVTLNKARAIVQSMVDRYVGIHRIDLAEAAVDTLVQAAPNDLFADWALWSHISLLERRAARALAVTTSQIVKDQKLPLDPFHKRELELIDQLLAEHDESPYRGLAANRVWQISGVYQHHKSWEVATSILRDFLTTNSGLTTSRKTEFQIVQIAIHRAQQAFSQRPDKVNPPVRLSDEHGKCIDLLTTFLTSHPTGDYSLDAENQLFNMVTTYGNAGAWSVAREVLDRFATAIPDFRSPQHLRLLKAATWLGELDRAYGVALLTPAPKPASDPTSFSAGIEALADLSNRHSSSEEEAPAGGAGGGEVLADVLRADLDAIITNGVDVAKLMEPKFNAYYAEAQTQPSETALAMIRQSQQRQFQQLAMMEDARRNLLGANQQGQFQNDDQSQDAEGNKSISLPTGSVLSEAEMKRQDEAADQAYSILVDIIRTAGPDETTIKSSARAHAMWLFGFFEGQLRADQANVLINRYQTDLPADSARVALAFQAINNQLTWAAQRQPNERVNLAWLDRRHELFEEARASIKQFVEDFDDETDWVNRALLLNADSYQQEAQMTAVVSNVRAGGLLVRSADALMTLLQTRPDHPQCGGLDQRMWNIAERLRGLGQLNAAHYVLSQIPIHFPTNPLAQQSVLRIAELHAINLSQPLKAVETYQEFLSLNGDNEQVRSQIFEIARQLAARQRHLESLHVYGVFVDSFPADPRAAEALQAMGRTHQTNEVWSEAIQSYQRILSEYANVPIVPQVKLAVAECQINLSHWREARKLYDEFVRQYPDDGQANTARTRLDVLKKLARYETLLADQEVMRHKDDAQYEIGRIVLTRFNNPAKAIKEFEKVVANFPNSDVADDAQLEIGKAYLALQRMVDAREALLLIPVRYPTSPLADDALYLVAQSYEQQATRLASVTLRGVRDLAFGERQRGAYKDFNDNVGKQMELQAQKRSKLKSEGKSRELALDEASQSFRQNSLALSGLSNTARRAEQLAETESALQVANRQDRINEANREAVKLYMQAATDYPLGDKTDDSLLRIAQIFETQLKDRPAAMETYQKIVNLFPGTPVAEDAAWNVASFHQQEGHYELAASALRDFIRSYPASVRVADAQYSLAEALEELGQWVDAMDEYETFRQKFSEHPKAVVAQDQINWIRTYRK